MGAGVSATHASCEGPVEVSSSRELVRKPAPGAMEGARLKEAGMGRDRVSWRIDGEELFS